jgi:hypothetical protein
LLVGVAAVLPRLIGGGEDHRGRGAGEDHRVVVDLGHAEAVDLAAEGDQDVGLVGAVEEQRLVGRRHQLDHPQRDRGRAHGRCGDGRRGGRLAGHGGRFIGAGRAGEERREGQGQQSGDEPHGPKQCNRQAARPSGRTAQNHSPAIARCGGRFTDRVRT